MHRFIYSAHHYLQDTDIASPTILLLSVALFLLQSTVTVAIPVDERANGAICQNALYGKLVPILKQFGPAQAYFAVVHPPKCAGSNIENRAPVITTLSTSTSSRTTTKTTTESANPKESACS